MEMQVVRMTRWRQRKQSVSAESVSNHVTTMLSIMISSRVVLSYDHLIFYPVPQCPAGQPASIGIWVIIKAHFSDIFYLVLLVVRIQVKVSCNLTEDCA